MRRNHRFTVERIAQCGLLTAMMLLSTVSVFAEAPAEEARWPRACRASSWG